MNSHVIIPADGTTRLFTVPFPYISQTHVRVLVNRTIQLVPLHYRWVGPTAIEFITAPTGKVELQRFTPIDGPLVQFQNGAQLTEDELNLAVLQNLFISQETRDRYDSLIDGRLDEMVNGGGGNNAGTVIDRVVEKVLDSELLAELNSRIGDIDLNALTINGQRVRLDNMEEAMAALSTIEGGPVTTFLFNERQARIDGDEATNTTLDLLGAKSGDGLSFILDVDSVKVSPTESVAARLSHISSELDGHTAAIEETATTVAGVSAQYMVKTDVDGNVAGFGLWNSGDVSEFTILVDRFAVVAPGATPVVPFAVDGSGVYMNTAYIRHLTVDKITTGDVNAQWNFNTSSNGLIVIDTGTYMKVIGAGFGASADLIQWFGPKMAVGLCTKANGITWEATNGDAYFGGSLSAGTFFNARSTSEDASDAEITVGPFGTLGNQKTVTSSLSFFNSGSASGNVVSTYTGPTGAFSAVITVYRKVGSGSEAPITTYSVTGHATAFYDNESNTTFWQQQASGGTTYYDSTAGTSDFSYRAKITSRTAIAGSGSEVQTLTVTSTEE